MKKPKYSIVIPTLNGAETLSVTLPEMLKIDYDDMEWVISDNHSDDKTEEIVSSFSDRRVRLVSPPKRLPISEHLEFAYQQANGEWQSHIGDDDLIFPSRFKILDDIIDKYDVTLVRGGTIHYFWPSYLNADLANTLDGKRFSGTVHIRDGKEMLIESLNSMVVCGGGSWVVHHTIIDKIRARCGYFSSPKHVEFFAMRAACAVSPKVATIDLPIWVLGRHEKSSGSQALRQKGESSRSSWDWSFESPGPWKFCPFQYNGYASISFDAALLVQNVFPDIISKTAIDWIFWINHIKNDIENMINREQLTCEARVSFYAELKKRPIKIKFLVWLHKGYFILRLPRKIYHKLRFLRLTRKLYHTLQLQRATARNKIINDISNNCFGWPDVLHGDKLGIRNILDVPAWVEKTFYRFFPK